MGYILRNTIDKKHKLIKGLVYNIPCSECNVVYIGETARTLEARIDEHKGGLDHRKPISKLIGHALDYDHMPSWNETNIIHKNCNNWGERTLLEAIETKKNPHAINTSRHVPEIYAKLLKFHRKDLI